MQCHYCYYLNFQIIGTTLTGEGGSFIQATRSDFLYFSASSRTVQLCFPHTDDSIPCEDDIIGTLRLLNNSGVNLGNPSSAAVTIQDDDCELLFQFT